MTKPMSRIAIPLLMLFLIASGASACQWFEYSLDGLGTGYSYVASGGDGVGVALATSNSLLFFNARTDTWIEHELEVPLTMVGIKAKGYLVLVLGTDRAYVFNTKTSSVSELVYQGTLMSTNSYDCGQLLALVVTDQEFCVFDAELDQWRIHSFTLSGTPYTTSKHQCHDFYAVSFLRMPNGDAVNFVYSLNQHDFNETTQGMYDLIFPMDYGYAGYRSIYGYPGYYFGYSAVHNTFDSVPVPAEANLAGMSQTNINPSETIGMKTSFAGYYYEYDTGDVRDYHVYAFDTRHGNWLHQLISVNRSDYSLSNWAAGGTFATVRYHDIQTDTDDLLIFNGTTNTLFIHELDFDDDSSVFPAGNVMMTWDSASVLGISLDGMNQSTDFTPDTYGRYFPGINYLNYLSDGPGEDMVTINYYNGDDNTWLHHTTGFHENEGWGSGYVHLRLTGDAQREAVFYSVYRNEIYPMSLAGWPAISPTPTDNYAVIRNDSEGIGALYDAHRGNIISWSGVNSTTVAQRIFTTINNTTHEANAYSTITGNWTSQALEADGVVCAGRDMVSLLMSATGSIYNCFYACDASDGNWAVLHPYGLYKSRGVGDRTAFYVTNYYAYALGTVGISGVPEETPDCQTLPMAKIEQIHPNPFNPSTAIEFSLGELKQVKLCIYDLAGHRVRVLMDETLTSGSYTKYWDGCDDSGRAMASGMYSVSLESAGENDRRKVMLVR